MSNNLLKDPITRREVILRVGAMLGGVALVGQSVMLAGCDAEPRAAGEGETPSDDALFTQDEIALLDEIAETILPETGTPGAKAAGVGPFMALMVTDVYYPVEQKIFKDGMRVIREQSVDLYGTDFAAATPQQRLALLEGFDAEQLAYMQALEAKADSVEEAGEAPAHFFRMMKELALLGYFTSEIGYEQAMRYAETPGRYDPCLPYEPGEKTWAPHA